MFLMILERMKWALVALGVFVGAATLFFASIPSDGTVQEFLFFIAHGILMVYTLYIFLKTVDEASH